MHVLRVKTILIVFIKYHPLEGGSAQRAEWVNTYGLRVAKSPSSLMSFCCPHFIANDCYFACVSFHILVLSFLLHFLQFPVLPVLSLIYPSKTCSACPLQAPPPAYSLSHPSIFSSLVHLSRTSLPKILLSMPVPGPSSSVLPYPSLPHFPVLWIYLYCVCNVFSFSFCFTGILLKNVVVLDELFFLLIWFLFI